MMRWDAMCSIVEISVVGLGWKNCNFRTAGESQFCQEKRLICIQYYTSKRWYASGLIIMIRKICGTKGDKVKNSMAESFFFKKDVIKRNWKICGTNTDKVKHGMAEWLVGWLDILCASFFFGAEPKKIDKKIFTIQ